MPITVLSERVIPLQEPVRVYTAKELAVMPLSQMIARRDAQENYYTQNFLTMGDVARHIKEKMQGGESLIQVHEKSRTRYRIGEIYYPPRIIRQLAARGLVKLATEEGKPNE